MVHILIITNFRALVTKREDNLRVFILLMIFTFELTWFIESGKNDNQYLYLRRKLNWDFIDYTTFTIVVGVVGMASKYIVIPLLSEQFKLRDSVIVIISLTGCIGQTILFSIATVTWVVYLGALMAILDSTCQMIRCMISKTVNPNEVGKIFSIVGALQAIIPLIASPVFGNIYRSTVETLPQAYLIVLACLLFVGWCIMIYIDRGLLKANLDEAIEMNDMSKIEERKDVIGKLLSEQEEDENEKK